MNEAGYLLSVNACSLSRDEKLLIKRLGPHLPADFVLSVKDGIGKQGRSFYKDWYIRFPWLTVGVERKCFLCSNYENNECISCYFQPHVVFKPRYATGSIFGSSLFAMIDTLISLKEQKVVSSRLDFYEEIRELFNFTYSLSEISMQSPPEMKVHLSWVLLISQMSTYMCSIHKMPYVSSFSSISKSDDLCRFTLVESIPENLTFSAHSKILLSTYEAHKRLLANARISVHITSFYWTLLPTDISYHDTSSYQGKDIFNRLYSIAKGGSVDVKIAQNVSNNDTNLLASVGAQVRTLDFDQLLNAGVLHTKMWLVDNQHAYIGSANLDWRSYTQVKELGILIENCPVLCQDIAKLFEVYWYLGKKDAEVPKHWPQQFSTNFNSTTPLLVHFNDTEAPVFLSSSPPSFCPEGRSNDIDAILYVIQSAQKFIYISVMDYIPAIIYKKPYRFWPIIDDELRRALLDRRLTIYLMTGSWEHTRKEMHAYLESLAALWGTGRGDVQVKLFVVPYTPEQHKIPYARVNHCKYMVTDQHAYIGTSNWSGDYFTVTGGVGFIVQQPTWQNLEDGNLRQQLEDTFLRDWTSNYSTPIGH